VAAGALVLVDGWNHFLSVNRCFGYAAASAFPIDRLSGHLAAETGVADISDVVVVMAIPDRNQPGERADFETWRRRLNKLRNFGVRHERARFSYRDLTCVSCRETLSRDVTCPSCGKSNPQPGRRKEKGADTRLAALAINGAWRQDYSALILLSQDSDFAPVIRDVKEIHRQQGRTYALYSAYPVCTKDDHHHWAVPGTKKLPMNADVYAKLASQRFTDHRTATTPA
jgi:hypothetical protein